jgi:Phage tail sheath protein FI
MPEYLYPGVYVEEIDTGNKPIEGVSTSTVGFLGVAERGPEPPLLVTSFGDYVRAFGRYIDGGGGVKPAYLAYAVEGFFQNGGKRCFIQRVFAPDGIAAANVFGSLSVSAVGKGEWGNRVGVQITQNTTNNKFQIAVSYFTTPIVANKHQKAQVTEVFSELGTDPLLSSYSERQINGISNLITVTQTGPKLPDVTGAPDAPVALAGGGDGSALQLGDFLGDVTDPPGQKRGLDAFTENDEVSLLCCPDEYYVGENTHIQDAMIAQSELMMDRFAILSSIETPKKPGDHVINYNSKYAAYYYPWLNVVNPITGKMEQVPPGGHVAGIYARSDDVVGVHKDPANEIIRGIDSLALLIGDQQQALLNPIGINVLRYFKGSGNLVWGGRTTTTDPDWKYINVRRLFIFVEKSIRRSTGWVVFGINDEPLWARVRRSVSDFLTRLWIDGMLQGKTKEEAYFVRCDRTTMTQADIDNGKLICLIGIAPVKPAEFVIFRIGQWDGGSSVQEG